MTNTDIYTDANGQVIYPKGSPTEDTPTHTGCLYDRDTGEELVHYPQQDDKLREAVKRFCRTEEAADNLVAYIKAQQIQLVTELMEQAEDVVSYGDLDDDVDFEAVPLSVLEHKKQELERLQ